MVIYIETKYILQIANRYWLSEDHKPLEVLLYEIRLSDLISKKVLTERIVHKDEILSHVEDILPVYYNQIKNQIKQQFNLS
jgi:hypothetical protein